MIILHQYNIDHFFLFFILDRYLICIMHDALFDVHRGINSLLSDIRSK